MKKETKVRVPDGYELTGEVRIPKVGEFYLSPDGCARANDLKDYMWHRYILRRVKSSPAPSDAGERVGEADGAALIAAERARQQSDAEGYCDQMDDEKTLNQLVWAAICYATPSSARDLIADQAARRMVPKSWPWRTTYWKPTPDDRVRELVKAGALIAAEIDRLRREAEAIAQRAAYTAAKEGKHAK